MAFSIELVQEIEQKYKISGLTAAFEAEEVTGVALPERVNILSDDDLQRVKDDEYSKGKTSGVEMAVKDFKTEHGLEFQGKTLRGLVEAAQAKAVKDANIAPDERVSALQNDLVSVRREYAALEEKLAEGEAVVSRANTRLQIFKAVPSLGEGAMSMDKVLTLMEADGYSFSAENGHLTPMLNGEPLKDGVANVLPVEDVIREYAQTNNIVPAQQQLKQGRGGTDTPPAPVFTRRSEIDAHFKAHGKNTQGKAYMDAIREAAKTEGFDMNG